MDLQLLVEQGLKFGITILVIWNNYILRSTRVLYFKVQNSYRAKLPSKLNNAEVLSNHTEDTAMLLAYHDTVKIGNLCILIYKWNLSQIFPSLYASDRPEPQNKNIRNRSSDKPMKGQKAQWFHQHGKTWSRHPFQHSYEKNQKLLIFWKVLLSKEEKDLSVMTLSTLTGKEMSNVTESNPRQELNMFFAIKIKQKSPLQSEFLHTQIGKTSVISVHASCLCLKLWPNSFIQILLIIRFTHSWKTPQYSFTGGYHHMHPYSRSFCLLCQHKQGVFLPLPLPTHSLWSIKLLPESLLTSHLQCSWLSTYDDTVVWFYKALIKRSICSAIVILISRRGAVSRPSS